MDELHKRIEKVEESVAFGEHTADQLSRELLRAFQTIERLESRLRSLEARLESLHAAADEEAGVESDDASQPPAEA